MRRGDGLLIAALAGGASGAESARAAGVGLRTVQRRLADPGFRVLVTALGLAVQDEGGGTIEPLDDELVSEYMGWADRLYR